MRKQFKKGVAILSAVSMVAAGISYVPQNVKADAPVIAVQDSEEGVDYSSLTYTKAEPIGGGEFPDLYYSVITNELHANVGYLDAGATFQFAYSADNKQEDTKITVNGVETEPGAGVVSMYNSGLTKLNPKAMEDNAYTHVVITSTTGKLEIVFKKGTPASSGTTTEPTTTTAEPTTTTTEPTTTTAEPTTTTTTTTTTEAPEVTTPAKVLGLTYAGNETLPFYFAWQSVAGANGYNVYLDGKLITKVNGVTYEFSKDLFAEAREYIIAVAAVNEAGEGTKTEYKYTVESKEPDSTKNEETDSTKNEETTSTKNEETDSTKNEESNSSSSTEEDVKVPVAVTGLAYTGTEASFKFSWEASKGAESYNVYLNDKFVTSTVTPEYSFNSALFEKAGTYTISVEAVNKAGKSDKTSIEYVVEEPASSESTDESKGDNTEVTMPSDYTAFENNADFGYKFVSAPEAAKAEVKTDQGENLFIAFKAVEGFYPDYTGLKVNGTDVDVAKGAGITLPKSLLTKKVNEVIILDKDGKEIVINIFNVKGEGENPVTKPEESKTSGTDESKTTSTKNEETDSTKNEESNSSSSTEEDVKVPVAVTGLAYTGTEASFKFSWEASKGAESYNVYLNDKFVTSTVTPEYSFNSALFEKAGTYTISVEAVNKAGKSDKTSIEYVVEEPASSESTDESKGDNTEVTMPSDYTAFENNADFGYKFVSAPEAAKAEVKTDQGENLFIAFKAVEGFYPDYTGLKVNGTDVDVAKGAGITLPKSLLTKKVNEVVILDKDGKEVVLNVFNVNGEGEIPTSPSVTEPDASTPDVSTPDASTPDVSTPDASTPDASTPDASTPDVSTPDASTPDVTQPDVTTPDVTKPDVTTTSADKVTETSTKEDVETTPDSGKDESTAKPTVKPTTPKVTTAKPTVKPTTAKPTTKKVSLKQTKITKKVTKKLSSKKVKLTFKKVKGAKKYTVQVSTSKKFKKVLYKKTVKKTKVTLSSKKFKGKKKLYVRVKAVGAKKWSKAVKIKVK